MRRHYICPNRASFSHINNNSKRFHLFMKNILFSSMGTTIIGLIASKFLPAGMATYAVPIISALLGMYMKHTPANAATSGAVGGGLLGGILGGAGDALGIPGGGGLGNILGSVMGDGAGGLLGSLLGGGVLGGAGGGLGGLLQGMLNKQQQ
jgi:hypothetical protein